MKVEFELIGWFPTLAEKWKPRTIQDMNGFLRAVVESYLIDKENEEETELNSVGVKPKPIQNFEKKFRKKQGR